MKNVFSNKIIILIFVAVVLALLLSLKEIAFLFFESAKLFSFNEIREVILYDLLIFFYFFSLSAILLWINVTEGLSKNIYKNIALSMLITIVLCFLSSYIIGKLTFDQNLIRELFDDRIKEHHKHHPHPLSFFLIIRSFLLLLIIIVLGWIYNLALKKIDFENKYEKLRSESLQNQLNALNNQINPHFFFNSLNSLYSLINENQKEKSLEYLSNLSSVFRYILKSERKGLVRLSEELDFLNIYKNLLLVKFDQRLIFRLEIDKRYESNFIPELSLLPIIENVIKHNEISYKHPMIISIFTSENHITINNHKKQRLDIIEPGGIGLSNLNNRFKLLTNKEIRIENTEDQFSISLPLIISEM